MALSTSSARPDAPRCGFERDLRDGSRLLPCMDCLDRRQRSFFGRDRERESSTVTGRDAAPGGTCASARDRYRASIALIAASATFSGPTLRFRDPHPQPTRDAQGKQITASLGRLKELTTTASVPIPRVSAQATLHGSSITPSIFVSSLPSKNDSAEITPIPVASLEAPSVLIMSWHPSRSISPTAIS